MGCVIWQKQKVSHTCCFAHTMLKSFMMNADECNSMTTTPLNMLVFGGQF